MHKTGLLPPTWVPCDSQPWKVCQVLAVASNRSSQELIAPVFWMCVSTDPCLSTLSSQSKRRRHATSPTRRRSGGILLSWRAGLIWSRGNSSVLLVSTTDIMCSGQKDPCASIKPEKLFEGGGKEIYKHPGSNKVLWGELECAQPVKEPNSSGRLWRAA